MEKIKCFFSICPALSLMISSMHPHCCTVCSLLTSKIYLSVSLGIFLNNKVANKLMPKIGES